MGYEPGKGKHKGVTGALKCVMESGKVRTSSFSLILPYSSCFPFRNSASALV